MSYEVIDEEQKLRIPGFMPKYFQKMRPRGMA